MAVIEITIAETDTVQDIGEIMMTTLILTAADGATTATTRTPLATIAPAIATIIVPTVTATTIVTSRVMVDVVIYILQPP
jgi:hypothetical protein